MTSFVRRDIHALRFWSNITGGIFSDLTYTMTENEILSRLTQEPLTHIRPTKLAEMITRKSIYIPHPDENISKCRFDFDTKYILLASTGHTMLMLTYLNFSFFN